MSSISQIEAIYNKYSKFLAERFIQPPKMDETLSNALKESYNDSSQQMLINYKICEMFYYNMIGSSNSLIKDEFTGLSVDLWVDALKTRVAKETNQDIADKLEKHIREHVKYPEGHLQDRFRFLTLCYRAAYKTTMKHKIEKTEECVNLDRHLLY